jgi:hypothetical protein
MFEVASAEAKFIWIMPSLAKQLISMKFKKIKQYENSNYSRKTVSCP